jgi:hypothetical protein
MAFHVQSPRLFDKASIEGLQAGHNGVYGIYRANQWIYVGKGDIRERLLGHLNGDNACVLKENPSRFVYEVTFLMDEREQQLIQELNPICNRKAG